MITPPALAETVSQYAPCHLVGVVEMGLLEPADRQALRATPGLRFLPLFTQPELQEIEREGACLAFVPNGDATALMTILPRPAGDALCGWICTELAPQELATHLAQANFVQDDASDEHYLIRHYAPNVLPHLHARNELRWHQWYFAPIAAWWVPAQEGWLRLEGHRTPAPVVAPLRLDHDLRQTLAIDPLPYRMVAELAACDPDIFGDACGGQRVALVEAHLQQARQAGLTMPRDLTACVVLALRHDARLPKGWMADAVRIARTRQCSLFDAVMELSGTSRA